jgi:mRNA interferase YafQ
MIPIYTKRFEKDVKKAIKRGKNIDKLKVIIVKLVNNEILEKTDQDHPLIGNYKGRRECHIESDWLLIYKLIPEDNLIIFERTGTHSDLFN